MKRTKLFLPVIVLSIVISLMPPHYSTVMAQLTSSMQSAYSLNGIFRMVNNSVVQITTMTNNMRTSSNNTPDNIQRQNNATEVGSGFVYDTLGHIITNN